MLARCRGKQNERHNDDECQQRGQQPEGPAHVETPEADSAGPVVLLHQQCGDEKPAQRKEHIHPEPTPDDQPRMKHHDAEHRHTPEPVKLRPVP